MEFNIARLKAGSEHNCSDCFNQDNEWVPARWYIDGARVCLSHLLQRFGEFVMRTQ